MKEFVRDYRGTEIWYDKGTNFWRCPLNLQARDCEELKKLIDEKLGREIVSPCIIIHGSHIGFHNVLGKDGDDFIVHSAKGNATIASPDHHFKDTPENRKIVEKILKALDQIDILKNELEGL